MAGKGKTLEDSFNALEEILEKLEDEEVSLEASFKLYQEGMKLVKKCNQSIDKVEKELVVISEEQ
ncbi:exodeoxyribonuclease 7 small subunit [Clostridium sp. CAG:411]|nr:exodeoxyribonuclease VII small subunit [Lachnospiraceae bacterium]CDE47279.1 exodeoxyribonuclease 7 small subunit [Clostridium sp. CAG:411]